MGSGIGSLDDVYETTVAFEKGVCSISPCLPQYLIYLGLPKGVTTVRPAIAHQSRCWSRLDALWLQSKTAQSCDSTRHA